MADSVEIEPDVVKKDKPSPTKPVSDTEETGSEEKSSSVSPDLNGSKTGEGSPDPETKEPSTSPVETIDSDVQMSGTAEGSPEPEPKDTPSPVGTTDSGGRMSSDSPEGSKEPLVKNEPEDGKSEAPLDEYDDSSSEYASDTDFLETIYRQVEAEICNTNLDQVLKNLEDKITNKAAWLPDDDHSDYEHELDVVDDMENESWKVTSPALRDLEGMCWRIVDTAKRCYARYKDFNDSKLQRLIRHVELVDEEMCDIARNTVTVVVDVSDVKNLTTVMRYLSAKGNVTVKVSEVIEKIDAVRVWSHYRGFSLFREEDMKDLKYNGGKLEDVCDKWDELSPYLNAFIEETSPLKQMEGKWHKIEMTVPELEEWQVGLKELVKTKDKLISFLEVINKDMELAIRDYCQFQKYITSNLNTFLNLDIANLFNVLPLVK